MNKPVLIGVAVLAVIIGGYLVFARKPQSSTGNVVAPERPTQQSLEEQPAANVGEEETTSSDSDVKEIQVTAKQFEFDPNPIRVSLGDRVRLRVKSIDVTHGFSIPELGIDEVLEPNNTVTIEFVADKKGEFQIACSVFCGSGHSDMKGKLIVE